MGFDQDLGKIAQEAIEKALKSRGKVNVIIAGKTGVGKSTLINAVFQGKLATTGQGRPVTDSVREVKKKGIPVIIYDTRGLEVAKYDETTKELEMLIDTKRHDEDPKKHIHVVWLCISEDSRRVEEAEIELVNKLSKYVPVIVVITKARADEGFRTIVQKLLPEAKNVVRVRALKEVFDDGHELSLLGLNDLVELTMEVVPEGQKNAFAAAQKVNLDKKAKRAHIVVASSAAAAAGVAATPIPFSDAIALIPIQIGMLAGISVVFGLSISEGFISTLVSGTFTGLAGTFGGRALVGALLKFIPGVGSVAGGAIAAGVAGTLTTTFGEAYVGTLYLLMKKNPDKELTPEEIAEAFKKKLKITG